MNKKFIPFLKDNTIKTFEKIDPPIDYSKLSGLSPFPLREFHSDNGKFINHVVSDWHRNPACPAPVQETTKKR
jgi:hypothetical protein